MHLLKAAAVPLLVLIIGACPGRNDLAGISDSTFVEVMAQLHRIDTDQQLTPEERDSLRRTTLQEEGLTPERLEAAARELADTPERALAIWQEIERRSRGEIEPPPLP